MHTQTRNAHFSMLLWTILIATSFPVTKMIPLEINAASWTGLRFLLAALPFLPWLLLRREWHWPGLHELARHALLGALLAGYFWSLLRALKTSTPLHTVVLFTLAPGLTALMGWLLLRERPALRTLVALVAGLLGACWVILQGSWHGLDGFVLEAGDRLFLLGCVSLALHGTLSRPLRRQGPPRSAAYATFWILLCGGLELLLLALFELHWRLDWGNLDRSDLQATLYLSLCATCLTFWLLQYSLPLLGASTVMAYSYLTPSLVLLGNALLWRNSVAPAVWPGIALSLLALLAMSPLGSGWRRRAITSACPT